MSPILHVGNRNYSSWSIRPWLVLRFGGIPFETRTIQLGGPGYLKREVPAVLQVSPSGTVPVLHVDGEVIGDSLAISEWAAEKVPSLWPTDPVARAQARDATCEMHSSFGAVRSKLPCNIRRRAAPRQHGEDLLREIARIEAIWVSLRGRFGTGGPYLFGAAPTIPDAFFTPIASRFRTYGMTLGAEARAYADALLSTPAFLEWEAEAVKEPWTMPQWDSA